MRKYKKVSCHDKKSTANNKAKKMREDGKTATVIKEGKKYCVKSAGKRKTRRKKRK